MLIPVPAPARRASLVAVIAALAAQAAPPVVARAQAPASVVTIVGYVTDTAAAPIPAAEVLVGGTALQVRTDEKGAFQFTGLKPGALTLTVRRLGFRARSDNFQARGGDTLQLMFDLVAIPAELAEVKVTENRVRRSTWLDEFETRRSRGFGSFVTRADIERRNPMRTSDLFRSITGVSVVNGRSGSELRMRGAQTCPPDIYIDGLEARGFRIDDIPPVDIAGIEVFKGPSETPVRFRRFLAGCGVVSIWTRPPGS